MKHWPKEGNSQDNLQDPNIITPLTCLYLLKSDPSSGLQILDSLVDDVHIHFLKKMRLSIYFSSKNQIRDGRVVPFLFSCLYLFMLIPSWNRRLCFNRSFKRFFSSYSLFKVSLTCLWLSKDIKIFVELGTWWYKDWKAFWNLVGMCFMAMEGKIYQFISWFCSMQWLFGARICIGWSINYEGWCVQLWCPCTRDH